MSRFHQSRRWIGIQSQRRTILIGLALGVLLVGFMAATQSERVTALVSNSIIAGRTASQASQANSAANAPRHLYIVSEVPRADGSGGMVSGHVSIVDLTTKQTSFDIAAGVNVDVLASTDGSRAFVAAVDTGTSGESQGEYVAAFDLQTRQPIWRTAVLNRVKYIGGGPSTLALSPDSRHLYVYSYSPMVSAGHVQYWFQIVDTATGGLSPQIVAVPDCGAASFRASADGRSLNVVCFESNDVRFVDLQQRQVIQTVRVPDAPISLGKVGVIAAAASSNDGSRIFVVTDNFRVATFDTQQRVISQLVTLPVQRRPSVVAAMATLSEDNRKLVVSEMAQDSEGNQVPGHTYVFDTTSWKQLSDIQPGRVLGQIAMSISPDGQSVYAVGFSSNGRSLPDADSVVAVGLSGKPTDVFLTRPGQEISAAFVGP